MNMEKIFLRLKSESARCFAKQIHEELKKEYISSDQYKEFNFGKYSFKKDKITRR